MPTIAQFYGITVRMYYNDHNPPHFHAYYGGDAAAIELDGLQVIAGKLPHQAQNLVIAWANFHRFGLRKNWLRCQEHRPLIRLPPLE